MEIGFNKQFNRNTFLSTLPLIREEEAHSGEDIPQFTFHLSENYMNPHIYVKSNISKSVPNHLQHFFQRWNSHELKGDITSSNQQIISHLSHHLQINCLINPNMKQSPHIWETILAKKLLNAQHPNMHNQLEEKHSAFNSNYNKTQFEGLQSGDLKELESPWKLDFRTYKISSLTQDATGNTALRPCSSCLNIKNRKKKSVNVGTKRQRIRHKGKKSDKTNIQGKEKSLVERVEKSRIEETEKKNVRFTESTQNSLNLPSTSTTSSVRRVIECVRAIFDNNVENLICPYCEKTFEKVSGLIHHKKVHEKLRPMCVICDESFATTGDLIEHLSLHESVDKFSCKTCKKYFPSSQKYQKHIQEVHFRDYKLSPIYVHSEESSDPRKHIYHTCPRCKEVFHHEDDYQNHKKFHMNADLAMANLLCSEFVNLFSPQ